MSDPLTGLAGWVASVVESLGYVGVALLVALENLVPPIPSEVILPLAGFLTGRGRLSFIGVLAAATTGSVAGALALYAVGRWLGEARLRRAVRRFGRPLGLEEADLDRAQRWFDRHGGKAVLIGRLVPVVRSLVSVPAGLAGMPLGRFAAYTALGSGLWNGALIGLGWALGDQWEVVRQYAQLLEYGTLLALVAAAFWFVWRRRTAGGTSRDD